MEKIITETNTCKKCNIPLIKGIALVDIYSGIPDFPRDKQPVTMSSSGKTKLVACLKCPSCGWQCSA